MITASATWLAEPFISVAFAVCWAMSVPLFRAKPVSAAANAAASLMPSPTIATVCPCFFILTMAWALSRGSILPFASSICKMLATALTAVSLSPLNSAVCMFLFCKREIASLLSSRNASVMAKAAFSWCMEIATIEQVCQIVSLISGSVKPQNSGVPIFTSPKLTTLAETPCPATTSILSTVTKGRFLLLAYWTMAVANGCDTRASMLAATWIKSFSL